jgi:dUTP pyrophosphatase
VEIPHGFEIQVRPRSGLAINKGLSLLNTPGTIDSDYRGEIKVIMVNLSPEEVQIDCGERIAQLVLAKHETAILTQADDLNKTERGEGGFGHTGTH